MKRALSRAALVIGTVFAVVFGISSAAYAGDTAECVSVGGYQRGCITHIDDGDTFEVCDTRPDDHGVYGAVQEYISGAWKTQDSQEDGGDPGCDSFHFDVVTETYDKYRLKICWQGTCDYDPFRE